MIQVIYRGPRLIWNASELLRQLKAACIPFYLTHVLESGGDDCIEGFDEIVVADNSPSLASAAPESSTEVGSLSNFLDIAKTLNRSRLRSMQVSLDQVKLHPTKIIVWDSRGGPAPRLTPNQIVQPLDDDEVCGRMFDHQTDWHFFMARPHIVDKISSLWKKRDMPGHNLINLARRENEARNIVISNPQAQASLDLRLLDLNKVAWSAWMRTLNLRVTNINQQQELVGIS